MASSSPGDVATHSDQTRLLLPWILGRKVRYRVTRRCHPVSEQSLEAPGPWEGLAKVVPRLCPAVESDLPAHPQAEEEPPFPPGGKAPCQRWGLRVLLGALGLCWDCAAPCGATATEIQINPRKRTQILGHTSCSQC